MSQTTKDSLVRSARKLFGKYGFNGVSVRQLSQEAQCNLAAVSYHFRGKDELYRHCLEECMGHDDRLAEIISRARSREDFEAKLRLFLSEFFAHMVEDADVVRMIMHEMHDPSPIGTEVMEKLHKKIPLQLLSFIETAQQDGFINPGLAPKIIVDVIFSNCTMQILFEDHIKRVHALPEGISGASYRAQMIDQLMLILSGGIYAV